MKNLVLVLLAALALIGSAAAWSSDDYLTYTYTKEMYAQADDPLLWFTGDAQQPDAITHASFTSASPYGTETGYVANVGPLATTLRSGSGQIATGSTETSGTGTWTEPSQTLTLTQKGSVRIKEEARDTQDAIPEISLATSAYQNMHFSGDYSSVWASFASSTYAGVAGQASLWDYTDTEENYPVWGTLTAADKGVLSHNMGQVWSMDGAASKFAEADIGFSSQSGLIKDMYTGTSLTSGSTSAWAGFTGGMGDWIQTETGDIETDHRYNVPFVNSYNLFPTI